MRALYDEQRGRPGIDPESAVRLMLAGLFHNIVHDRKLLREAQVNLAIRWFAGYRLHERLPDHSSLTRIRQRWGEALFRSIFQRVVQQCVEAGLVTGETVHVDATLIRADVSWESLTDQHIDRVLSENDEQKKDDDEPPAAKRSRTGRKKKVSRTDPDATLAAAQQHQRMEPSYKQHTAVDDASGVIVDVSVTTGEASEGRELEAQLDRVESNISRHLETVTADAGYAHSRNYAMLEQRKVHAVIPPQKQSRKSKRIPLQQFKYDERSQTVRCPRGKHLRQSSRSEGGWIHRAKRTDCAACEQNSRCVPPSAKVRTVKIVDGYPALLRARRRHLRHERRHQLLYTRHRWRVEGVHGEAKCQHGLRRAVRRRRWNVSIQAYLTATVINLKRLAASSRFLLQLRRLMIRIQSAHHAITSTSNIVQLQCAFTRHPPTSLANTD